MQKSFAIYNFCILFFHQTDYSVLSFYTKLAGDFLLRVFDFLQKLKAFSGNLCYNFIVRRNLRGTASSAPPTLKGLFYIEFAVFSHAQGLSQDRNVEH